MENNGNVICRAKFKANIIANIIKGLALFLMPFIIFTVLNRSQMDNMCSDEGRFMDSVNVKKGVFTQTIERIKYDPYNMGNFDTLVEYDGFKWNGNKIEKHYFFGTSNKASKPLSIIYIILISGLSLCVIVLPIINSKRCSLSLSSDQIDGQLKTTFGKKKLQLPIEHLDNVMTANSLMDKLRGGETIIVSSNSGIIRFHYVQNAEEFAAAAMKRIGEVKKSAPAAAQPAATPQPQNVTGGDAMEKINSLKQMLDSGLITQEQFEQKRDEILSKM